MPRITGLRSPHAKVGRLVYFGRMLDKIRLHAEGSLPPEYAASLGEGRPALFDGRCCRFLGVDYADLRARTLEGGCDEEILAWAHGRGGHRSDEECLIWNRFLTKLGWRDDREEALRTRVAEYGCSAGPVLTLCELLDADEGRPLGGTRSWETARIDTVVVMGVAGSGKTTVGNALAASLEWEFIEGDSLHSKANVAKMASGQPLTDADRGPWLDSVRSSAEAVTRGGGRAVVACSALKKSYRAALAPDPARVRFAYLRGAPGVMRQRLAARAGHYMKEGMLDSQLQALEEPREALVLDASLAPETLVERIRSTLGIP
jgi:carbohydrate kinase (thermoresistant glucokinase family)